MKITRTSLISGKTTTQDIPVTEEQLRTWEQGVLIQDAMPNLSDDEREFIMTGITPEEWEEAFGERCTKCDKGSDHIDYDTGLCPKCLDAEEEL